MLKFNPGDLCFVICEDYKDGGFPAVFIEEGMMQNHTCIIRKRVNNVMSVLQVASDEIIRELSTFEFQKYKNYIDFLKERYCALDDKDDIKKLRLDVGFYECIYCNYHRLADSEEYGKPQRGIAKVYMDRSTEQLKIQVHGMHYGLSIEDITCENSDFRIVRFLHKI